MKFGGAAVGTAPALTQVLSIVLQERERWDHLLLVVSALDGVTDALLEAAHLAQVSNSRGYRRIVATLRLRHLALVEQLPLGAVERNALQADIDRLLFDMLDTCQTMADNPDSVNASATIDQIIGVGERLAARIVAALLRQNDLRGVAIDATDLIVTDRVFGNAAPIMPLTRQRITQNLLPMFARGDIIPVVTGFIGATEQGQPTTMGRGGSDYTASILSVAVDASAIWMWTDVDGMMSADPHELPDARVIPYMSYEEVAELAYFGAHILHARMVGPLHEQRIPLSIKNIFRPRATGTLIREAETPAPHTLKAVTLIQGLGLTANHSGPLTQIAAIINEALQNSTGTEVEVMISAQSSNRSFVCFVVPTYAGPEGPRTTRRLLQERLQNDDVQSEWHIETVSIITLIGALIDETSMIYSRIFQAIGSIRLLALAQGPSRCSLSLVVQPEDSEMVLRQIHQMIISSD